MAPIGQRVGPFEITGPADVPEPGAWYHASRDPMSTKKPMNVLVKVLPADASSDERAELEKEYNTLTNLADDPRVPNAVGFYEGAGGLAIEAVQGVSLAEIVARRADDTVQMSPPTLLDIGIEVAEAIKSAHHKGRHHGHLSPDVIWLCEGGRLVVWGFGPGPDSDVNPAYAAPERVRKEGVTGATDQFGLAGLLTSLITGKPMWQGPSAEAVARRGDTGPSVNPIAQQWPALGRLLRKMTDNRPGNRHPSIHPVLQELLALSRKASGVSDRKDIVDGIFAERREAEEDARRAEQERIAEEAARAKAEREEAEAAAKAAEEAEAAQAAEEAAKAEAEKAEADQAEADRAAKAAANAPETYDDDEETEVDVSATAASAGVSALKPPEPQIARRTTPAVQPPKATPKPLPQEDLAVVRPVLSIDEEDDEGDADDEPTTFVDVDLEGELRKKLVDDDYTAEKVHKAAAEARESTMERAPTEMADGAVDEDRVPTEMALSPDVASGPTPDEEMTVLQTQNTIEEIEKALQDDPGEADEEMTGSQEATMLYDAAKLGLPNDEESTHPDLGDMVAAAVADAPSAGGPPTLGALRKSPEQPSDLHDAPNRAELPKGFVSPRSPDVAPEAAADGRNAKPESLDPQNTAITAVPPSVDEPLSPPSDEFTTGPIRKVDIAELTEDGPQIGDTMEVPPAIPEREQSQIERLAPWLVVGMVGLMLLTFIGYLAS